MNQRPAWLLYLGLIALGAFGSLGMYHLIQAIASPPPDPVQTPTESPVATVEPDTSPTAPPPTSSPPSRPSPSVAPEEPNQDDLSMSCSGSIQDSVDFTVFFTREAGFSRIELRPRTSDRTLTANLAYDGENDDGHSIWRGGVEGMASVVLVHLSTEAAQVGDSVSVGYDGRWGRAICQ